MVTDQEAWAAVPAGSWIEKFVHAVMERTDAPVAFAVGAAYAAASLAIPPDAYIQYGPRIYGQQYVCLVGESGTSRKSTVLTRTKQTLPVERVARNPVSASGLEAAQESAGAPLLVTLPEFGAFFHASKNDRLAQRLRWRLEALWEDKWSAPVSVLAAVTFQEKEAFLSVLGSRFLLLRSERERTFAIPPLTRKAMPPLPAASVPWGRHIGWTDDGEAYFASWHKHCAERWPDLRMDLARVRAEQILLKAAMAVIATTKPPVGRDWYLGTDVLEPACALGTLHLQSVESLLAAPAR